jgi:hypothetical protein
LSKDYEVLPSSSEACIRLAMLQVRRPSADSADRWACGQTLPAAHNVANSLPGYAPDLNATEQAWGILKSKELAHLCPDTIDEAAGVAQDGLDRMAARSIAVLTLPARLKENSRQLGRHRSLGGHKWIDSAISAAVGLVASHPSC